MKNLFLIVFCILGAMTLAAIYLKPEKIRDNKTSLQWTTDPNPQRELQVNCFNKLNPDIFLSIDPDNKGVMKVVIQSCAGMGPDIVGHINEQSYPVYHGAGILWNITEKAKELGIGPESLPEPVQPLVMIKEMDKNGNLVEHQYVYPCNIGYRCVFYNKNIFDRYGVPYPPEDLTWEEYIKIAQKLTRYGKNKNRIPEVFGGAGTDVITLIWEKGGRFLNEDGTRCLLDSKAVTDAMLFYHELLYKYRIEPTPIQKAGVSTQGGWGSGYVSWFCEGKVAMLWGRRHFLIQFRRFISAQKKAKEQWLKTHHSGNYAGPLVLHAGACLVPRFRNGKRYVNFVARCIGINKNSKKRDKALKFLQYLGTKDYNDTINRGADGQPGNKKYISLDNFIHPDWPEEKQLHEISIKSIPYARIIPRSPFVTYSTIMREFNIVKDKIISEPDLDRDEIARALRVACDKINLEIARNIKRNPKLMKLYLKMLENGAEPVIKKLEEIN